LVHLLEKGKQLYGVGTERQMCVLLDRAGTVYRNGKKKVEKFDMGVIPNLLDLFRHMYSTFTVCVCVGTMLHTLAQFPRIAFVRRPQLIVAASSYLLVTHHDAHLT
jgi:hypothetical protein